MSVSIQVSDLIVWMWFRSDEEYERLSVSDLNYVVTLGVGGFGRVELVYLHDNKKRVYALKQMKKKEVSQTHIAYLRKIFFMFGSRAKSMLRFVRACKGSMVARIA